jgi:hypothetical protein
MVQCSYECCPELWHVMGYCISTSNLNFNCDFTPHFLLYDFTQMISK